MKQILEIFEYFLIENLFKQDRLKMCQTICYYILKMLEKFISSIMTHKKIYL